MDVGLIKKNVWLRRLLGLLAGVLVLWGVAWLTLPWILKDRIEVLGSEQLGRHVSVGKVDFKPWSLEMTVSDLAVARASSGAAAVSAEPPGAQFVVKRIYIDAALQSLWRLAPVVDALSIESPRLNLTYLGDGHYDVDDVLAKFAAQPSAPASKPLGFALYNLVLSDGAVEFTDKPHANTHQLTQLQLSLPFLSNLASKRDVLVRPNLAFDLNGSRFDSTADATPFARTRKTDAEFKLTDFNLAPYLDYWPASLPLRLRAGVLNADLKLAFEQTAQPAVTLSGEVSASAVRLAASDASGQASGKVSAHSSDSPDLLSFERLNVQLKSVQPVAHAVQLGRVDWVQPRINVQRARNGQLNWLALFGSAAKPNDASKNIADDAISKRAKGLNGVNSAAASAPAAVTPWQLSVDQIAVKDGEIRWADASTAVPARLTLSGLDVQAQALTWPFKQAMPIEGRATLDKATLNFKGSATDQAADISAQITDMPLSLAAPYLADVMTPTLNGSLATELGLSWQAASGLGAASQPGHTRLQVRHFSLDKLALLDAQKAALASIAQVQVDALALDLGQQTATVTRARIKQPQTTLARAQDGRWMFEDWLKPLSQPQPPAVGQAEKLANQTPHRTAEATKPWTLALNDVGLDGGNVQFRDNATSKPVAFDLQAVSVQLKNFSTAGNKPFGLNLAMRMRHGHTEPGSLVWRGSSTMSPPSVQGELNAARLPLHALEPYLSERLNVELLRADTSFKGRIRYAQQGADTALQVHGDTQVEDFRAFTLAQTQTQTPSAAFKPAEELLNWKDLSLRGLDIALSPGVAPRVAVQETTLSDFYARLTLSEAGRLNLQDLMKPVAPVSEASLAPNGQSLEATKKVASRTTDTGATGTNGINSAVTPVIHVGPISLLGGRVDFTDHFIKPNYSASLTELTGKLGAFASESTDGVVQQADLELRGRAEGTATLEVLGKVNPLAKPLALDIKGKVRDLELSPLSPYSVRYAGYGIERGKLSVDVNYRVQPDGQLTASNNIVLNQLKFGDKDANATASLPVKLAVALLADRNGVIDINLPVSGSLNDPQFRLVPIIFKIIGNLIVKAITAPFSLLANALGGGGDELSMVNFEPGLALLAPEAKAGLDKVAKALLERPALKMTVVGTASLELERDAFKRAQLQNLLQREKRRSVASGAAATPEQTGPPVLVSAQDYPVLLKAAYKRADFPKPRNLIGLAKDIPVPEMEALLLANLSATEADMQALATRRGVAVRDYLASLKLPTERLFLGAAKAVPPEAKWRPRAELNLATE